MSPFNDAFRTHESLFVILQCSRVDFKASRWAHKVDEAVDHSAKKKLLQLQKYELHEATYLTANDSRLDQGGDETGRGGGGR